MNQANLSSLSLFSFSFVSSSLPDCVTLTNFIHFSPQVLCLSPSPFAPPLTSSLLSSLPSFLSQSFTVSSSRSPLSLLSFFTSSPLHLSLLFLSICLLFLPAVTSCFFSSPFLFLVHVFPYFRAFYFMIFTQFILLFLLPASSSPIHHSSHSFS